MKRLKAIDRAVLCDLPLDRINNVIFYKRDEITTDLICCDVTIGTTVWFFHEDQLGWPALIEHLECLPDFRADWYAAVANPPFAPSETIAFHKLAVG